MSLFWAAAIVLVLAWAHLAGWSRTGNWLALALLGQACALKLYRAGPEVSYHHYRSPEDLFELAVFGGGVVLQALLVTWGLRPHIAAIRAWIGKHLPGWRLVALIVAVLVSSAKISRPAGVSALEFLFATAVALVSAANLVLAVRALPQRTLERLDAFLDRVLGPESRPGKAEPGGTDRAVWVVAGLSVLVAALLNILAYERHPHVPDEVAYLIHARYFSQGLLELPSPPVPEGFDVDLMLLDGDRWFSPVPPGWPLALAVGAFFGLTWLVNPMIGGLTILAAYLFARELDDRRSARWTILLLAASPWFVFLNMSYMTHSWMLLCAVFAALGVARSRRTGGVLWPWAAGGAIGMASLVRPLEGLVLALALGLWAIGLGGRRLRIPAIVGLVLGTVAVGALVLPYNAYLTEDPLEFPIVDYVDRVYGPGKNTMGFGPDKGLAWRGLDPFPGHSPPEALINAQFNAFAINAELFGWSTGSLLLVFFLLFAAGRFRKDRGLLLFIVAIVIANSFYWFAGGPDFGARYWYLVILPLVMLTVSGIRALESRLGQPAHARALVCVLCALAWLTWMPWRAVDKYHDYRGMRPGIGALTEDFGRSLVLVLGDRHPDFASAATYNPLDLEADRPIYAWDRSPSVRMRLVEHYSDRPVWLVAGPSREGWRVLDGPVPADEVTADSRVLLRSHP